MSFDRIFEQMSLNASRVAAEARIDQKNAEKRQAFLDEFDVANKVKFHLCGSGRALGLPVGSKTVYPAFQFDEEGRPYHLVKRVLDALPEDMTPWQIAFWLVSPASTLDGGRPIDAIQRGDPGVIDAARQEASQVIG